MYMLQVSLTMGCPMDLQLFPLDSQTCHITVASYGWTADDVIYSWTVSEESQVEECSHVLHFTFRNPTL